MPDESIFVYEILGWPVEVIVRVPDIKIIVESNSIFDVCLFYGFLDIGSFFFESKLWGMYPNDHETIITVFFIPRCECGECSLTVYA